jgi:hypothetical protein
MKTKIAAFLFLFLQFKILLSQNVQDTLWLNSESLLQKILEQQIEPQTFSVRAKLTWDDGKAEQDFQMSLRLKTDSLVWLSLTGPLGVEGARILMTPDSFRIINKLANEYAVRNFSFFQNWLMFPASFSMLQQIILGQKINIQERAILAKREDSALVIYLESDKMQEKIWVNTESYTIHKILLKDKLLKQDMTITFGLYNSLLGKPFSYQREIAVNRDGALMKLTMEITKTRLNEELSFPFEVSDKYKRIE